MLLELLKAATNGKHSHVVIMARLALSIAIWMMSYFIISALATDVFMLGW